MAFPSEEREILEYYFQFMMGRKHMLKFLKENMIPIKRSGPIRDIVKRLTKTETLVTKKQLTKYARQNCQDHFYDVEFQKDVIQSDILDNHSWHEASPSRLHMIFQNWVREFLDKKIDFSSYLEKIIAVGKQEAYMLIGANLTEYTIFNASPEVLPTLRSRSISDLVLGNLAYDVKNTHNPRTAPENFTEDPQVAMEWLFDSGDLKRDLKTARKAPPHLGYNRIYIIIDPVEKWKSEYKKITTMITEGIQGIISGKKAPYVFKRQKGNREISISAHIFHI